MPLPTFATEAEIPELLKPDYVQVDGGVWRSKTELDFELEKGKRATLLDEKKAEKAKREEAEARAAELAREKEAKSKGVTDAELQAIREAEAAARKPIVDENETLKAENRKLKLTDRVKALALANGIMADRIDDAMLLLDKRTELGDADVIRVKDKDGKLTAESIEDFLSKTFAAEKPWLYEYKGGTGSGSGGSRGGSQLPTPAAKPNADHRARILAAI